LNQQSSRRRASDASSTLFCLIKFRAGINISGIRESTQVRRQKSPRNYWCRAAAAQLEVKPSDSVVTFLSHNSRAQERSGSAKLNFRLSVAGAVPQTTIRLFPVLVVESASSCPLHVPYFLIHTHWHLASFFLHGLTRTVTSRRDTIVFRDDGPCLWPHLQQTSQSQREGQYPVSYLRTKIRYNERKYQGLSAALLELIFLEC
jgi:hypothetical protein